MKILHVIESGGFYGAERVLTELLLGLTALGHDVTLLSFGRKGQEENPLEQICRSRSINVLSIRIGKMKALTIAGWVQVYAAKNDFDIVHSHGYKFNVLFALSRKRWRMIPVCTTLHGYVVTPTFSKMAIYQRLDRYCLKRLDAVFLVSERMKQIPAVRLLSENTVSVIENGIGGYHATDKVNSGKEREAAHKAEARLMTFLHGRGPRLMAAGRLAAEKGFDTLIEAMVTIVDTEPDTVLVIFGSGAEENRLKDKIHDLRLDDNILLFGFADVLANYYHYFDVFVMPSLTEGTPMALLEAMKAKIACVATKVGGIPHMLEQGNAGWLIEPENINQLALAIQNSLANGARHKKIARAYKRIKDHFHYLTMTQKYLRQYEKIRGVK